MIDELFNRSEWIITSKENGTIHYEHAKSDLCFTVDQKDPGALLIQLIAFYQHGLEAGYKKHQAIIRTCLGIV